MLYYTRRSRRLSNGGIRASGFAPTYADSAFRPLDRQERKGAPCMCGFLSLQYIYVREYCHNGFSSGITVASFRNRIPAKPLEINANIVLGKKRTSCSGTCEASWYTRRNNSGGTNEAKSTHTRKKYFSAEAPLVLQRERERGRESTKDASGP